VAVILNIMLLIGIIVLPMAAIWYGSSAFYWGFNNYPGATIAIAILLACGLVIAALTFRHFYPNCQASWSHARVVCSPEKSN